MFGKVWRLAGKLHFLMWPNLPDIPLRDQRVDHNTHLGVQSYYYRLKKSGCGHATSTYPGPTCSYTMSDSHPCPCGALECITHPTCNQVRQWLSEIALHTLSWVWWETGLIPRWIPDFPPDFPFLNQLHLLGAAWFWIHPSVCYRRRDKCQGDGKRESWSLICRWFGSVSSFSV